MENEIFQISLNSSVLTYYSIALCLQIIYISANLLKPYFIRSVENISLRYTQTFYFMLYEIIKDIILTFSTATYLIIFIINISGALDINGIFIWQAIGLFLLIIYIFSQLFIDFSEKMMYQLGATIVIILSTILNGITFILYIIK